MNRLLFIILFLASPYIMWAQAFISENDSTTLVEFHDGKQWVYKNIDGITVGMNATDYKDDYGRYYQIGLFICNERDTSITFNPEEVFADLMSIKGDTISLEVYTNEKFQKKLKRSQTWAMVLYGLSEGLNAASAGYTTTATRSYSPNGYSYIAFNQTYNAAGAYNSNMASTMRIATLGKRMDNDRAVREQGYLKLNTIRSGDAIVGYMNIKHKKGTRLRVALNVENNNYSYLWDVKKHKKSDKK